MMGFVSRVSLGHPASRCAPRPGCGGSIWPYGLALLRLASDWLPPFAAIGHLLTAAGWLLLGHLVRTLCAAVLPAARGWAARLRAAHKTLLALLPDLAVLLVLSAVGRLARRAALGFC